MLSSTGAASEIPIHFVISFSVDLLDCPCQFHVKPYFLEYTLVYDHMPTCVCNPGALRVYLYIKKDLNDKI